MSPTLRSFLGRTLLADPSRSAVICFRSVRAAPVSQREVQLRVEGGRMLSGPLSSRKGGERAKAGRKETTDKPTYKPELVSVEIALS